MTRKQLIAAVGVAGASFLIFLGYKVLPDNPTPPPVTTTTVQPTPSTTSTTVVAPAGSNVFTVPVAGLTISPDSQRLADNFRRLKIVPNLGLSADDYAITVCDVSGSTQTRRIYRKLSQSGAFNLPLGSTIPWSDRCVPPSGTDGFMVLLDGGHEWDIWQPSWPAHDPYSTAGQCWSIFGPNWQAGLSANYLGEGDTGWLCASSVYEIRDAKTDKPVDYRTYSGSAEFAGGVGLPNTRGLVGPAGGATALRMMIPNTSYLTSAVAPAGQWEWRGGVNRVLPGKFTDSQSIPEGTRFALKLTPAQIDAWLDTKGYTGALRATVRSWVQTMVTYGWFITDTEGDPASAILQFASDPTGWRKAGVTGTDLLAGLPLDSLYALDAPTSQCVTGTPSKLACPHTSSAYPR